VLTHEQQKFLTFGEGNQVNIPEPNRLEQQVGNNWSSNGRLKDKDSEELSFLFNVQIPF